MGSFSSESEESDQLPRGSYSLSADVSESESSTGFSSSPLLLRPPPGFSFPVTIGGGGKDVVFWDDTSSTRGAELSEIEMMKERFAKLLLGEDMSGGGKGVCTALAISNAITNLSATVFGELWRLEPLAAQRKAMWCREMEWLLCVSDSIVELVPSIQQFPGGGTYEVMATRPRSDLYINLPGLKKLDSILISILDGFQDTEFWYVDRSVFVPDADDENNLSSNNSSGRPSIRQEEKWWLPFPKVPLKGLSENARKKLQQSRDCTSQILKAAMAINSSVLVEMEVPSAYMETLPKCGKACLGDIIYNYITAEQFTPECLLNCIDLSSEHQTLEVANRIEAAVYVWKRKSQRKDKKQKKSKRSTWGGKVKGLVIDGDKNEFLAERAEALLRSLRLRFPALPQTALDMTKIQYNKDVGQSILESYSRVTESLAFNITARIDDVFYADDAIKRCSQAELMSIFNRGGLGGFPIQKRMSPSPFSIQHTPFASPFATPTFCASPPLLRSPGRTHQSLNKSSLKVASRHLLEKPVPVELEKLWSYAGNLSSRRISGDAPERD